jgi:hypothetical protein
LAGTFAALSAPGSYTGKNVTIMMGENAAPVIGDSALAMYCDEFKYSAKMAVRDAVTADVHFGCSDNYRPDFNAVVLAYATITNTTNFASVNNGAPTTASGIAYLQVITPPAADTYSIKVQHATDDSTWVDLCTFTANGSVKTSERQATMTSATIRQYIRAQATRAGANAQNFKLAIVYARW